jgi:hypothetical protein
MDLAPAPAGLGAQELTPSSCGRAAAGAVSAAALAPAGPETPWPPVTQAGPFALDPPAVPAGVLPWHLPGQ